LAALATTSNADGTISLVLVECAHATSGMSSPDFGLDASKICCFAITLGGCFFGTLAGDAVLVVDAVAWNWSAFHASTLGGLFANFEAAQWAACERDLWNHGVSQWCRVCNCSEGGEGNEYFHHYGSS